MLKYICGSTKEEIELSGPHIKTRIKTAGFHDFEWDENEVQLKTGSRVRGFGRKSKKYDIEIDIRGSQKERATWADKICNATERDVIEKTEGSIVYGDWYAKCFLVGSSYAGKDDRVNVVRLKKKVYMPYPFWIKENPYTFHSYDIESTNNKEFPFKYPYRYANGLSSTTVVNPHFSNANFKMIIYGPVVNPQVTIGVNTYLVNIILEEGERIEIDSRSETISKVRLNGEIVNAYHNRQKGKEFFNKITPGRQFISWTGKFDFDLIIYEERSEPKWSQLT